MELPDSLLKQLCQKISGSSNQRDWEIPLIGGHTAISLVANLFETDSGTLAARMQDPKTILVTELLKKIGPDPNIPLIPGTNYTPFNLVNALIGITDEAMHSIQVSSTAPPPPPADASEAESLPVEKTTDKFLWGRPLLSKRDVYSLTDLESFLYFIIKKYTSQNYSRLLALPEHNERAVYDDIASYLWQNYPQEVSDYGHTCKGPHRPYYMHFLIKEALFSDICAVASAAIESAGSAGISYADIIRTIEDLPEYKVLLRVWAPFRIKKRSKAVGAVSEALRTELKECFADYVTSGKTSSLRWHAKNKLDAEGSSLAETSISDKCNHTSRCASCNIKLRCRICMPRSSPNSSGQVCIRCSTGSQYESLMRIEPSTAQKVESIQLPEKITEEELKDIEQHIELVVTQRDPIEDIKDLRALWEESVLAPIEHCSYPPNDKKCQYISPDNTQYKTFKDFVQSLNSDIPAASIPSLPDNPYHLVATDYAWYDHIYKYYINPSLDLDLETLNNIGKRFGVSAKHICDTMQKVMKIDLGICFVGESRGSAETPTPQPILKADGEKYKLMVCIEDQLEVPSWFYDAFEIELLHGKSSDAVNVQKLQARKPDAVLIWHVPSTEIGAHWKKACKVEKVPVIFRNKGVAEAISSAQKQGLAWFVQSAERFGGVSRRNPAESSEGSISDISRLELALVTSPRRKSGIWRYKYDQKVTMEIMAIPLRGSLGDYVIEKALAYPCIFIYANVQNVPVLPENSLFIRGVTGDKVFYISKYLIADYLMAEYLARKLKSAVGAAPDFVITHKTAAYTIDHRLPGDPQAFIYPKMLHRGPQLQRDPWIVQEFAHITGINSSTNIGIYQHGAHAKFASAFAIFNKEPLGEMLLQKGYAAWAEYTLIVKSSTEARMLVERIYTDPYLKDILYVEVVGEKKRYLKITCLIAMLSYLHAIYIHQLLDAICRKSIKLAMHQPAEFHSHVRAIFQKRSRQNMKRVRKILKKRKKKSP